MIKAYYVIRKDLNLTPAKLAVQVGHGTQYIVLSAKEHELARWIYDSDSRKIVCGIKNLFQLKKFIAVLNKHFMSYKPIIDFGYTEVEPNTLTGIAFFIDEEDVPEEVKKHVKRLQLYDEHVLTAVSSAYQKGLDDGTKISKKNEEAL